MSEKKSKHSSIGLAESALDALLQAVSKNRTDDAANFVSMLEDMKKKWKDAGPSKTGCVNMVDRAIKFIHEAYEECEGDPDIKPIAGSELSARSSDGHLPDIYNVRSFRNRYKELRREVLSKLADLKEELGTVIPMICQQSIEHIHVNEIVMTSGYSTTILEFCKKVRASGRQFHIIVAESEPVTAAHAMAKALAEENIDTTLIPECNVFALMARVNKVLLSADVVTADGGIVAPIGTFSLCLAAQQYQVPVLVCAGMYKFSPRILCSYDIDSFNHMGPASTIAQYSEGAMVRDAHMINPLYDYIPPSLVNIIITNTDSYAPQNIYRAVADLYVSVTS